MYVLCTLLEIVMLNVGMFSLLSF